MVDFLKWVLGNFWHFLGFVIILGTCVKGIVALVAILLGRNVDLS